MKDSKLPTLVVAAALAAFAFHVASGQPSGIIARVDGEDVTAASLAPFFSNLSGDDREALEENPAALNQAVRNLITRRLLVKEALAAGWDQRPEVQERMEQAREAVVLEAYLAEVTKPSADYPSSEQVSELYEARKADLVVPPQLLLSQIYVPCGRDADNVREAAAKALVDQAQKKLKAGDAEFLEVGEELASETPVQAGQAGWIAPENLQPEIREAVASAAKGAVVGPVRLDDGFYLVQVEDIRERRTPALDEVKDQLAEALRQQRARQNLQAYLARLQQQYPVSINELSLGSLLKTENKAN